MLKQYDIAVIFGGVSGENEVSVITGTMVCNVLLRGGKTVLPVYITHSGASLTGHSLTDITAYKGGEPVAEECAMCRGGFIIFKKGKPKARVGVGCIINCCHGGVYEGGAVTGAALYNGIPTASPGLFESAAFMNKYLTKLVLSSLGIKTVKYRYFKDITGVTKYSRTATYPKIVKPCSLGSSIGIAVVSSAEELIKAAETVFVLDSSLIVEEYITPKREINCAAYGVEGGVVLSPCEEVFSSGEILSYDDKYSGGGTHKLPADLSGDIEGEIRSITKKIYTALSMTGPVRLDFIVSEGEVFVSEINTVPGSLAQYLFSKSYGQFYEVLCELVALAKYRFKEQGKKKIITTGILNNITPNACKLK